LAVQSVKMAGGAAFFSLLGAFVLALAGAAYALLVAAPAGMLSPTEHATAFASGLVSAGALAVLLGTGTRWVPQVALAASVWFALYLLANGRAALLQPDIAGKGFVYLFWSFALVGLMVTANRPPWGQRLAVLFAAAACAVAVEGAVRLPPALRAADPTRFDALLIFVLSLLCTLLVSLGVVRFRELYATERERRQAAEALEESARRLNAAEERLRQAERLEAIGRFTGGIAHDFNNLLTVILGNADLMARQLAPGSPLLPLAEMTAEAAERGADLTQRLLAFARRQTLAPTSTDLNRLVANLEPLIRRAAGEGVEVEYRLAAEPLPIRIDVRQLEAALLNLAVNARDAMPAGGRLVLATGRRAAHEAGAENPAVDGYAHLAVQDDGIGMAEEVREHAFDPFFTTKPVGQGTGLGLSMVHGFVVQSGGHVRIDSTPGQGTVVHLFLPALAEAATPAAARPVA